MTRCLRILPVALSVLLAPAVARGEGSAQLGVNQHLETTTVVYADIAAPATERICWTGDYGRWLPNGKLQK